MKVKVAISGFGRIGRLIFRAWLEDDAPNYDIVALNGIRDAVAARHLLCYDSIHGRLNQDIQLQDDRFITKHGAVKLYNQRELGKLDWRADNIDIVLECSGKFNDRTQAASHIEQAGAKKVLVSAPCKQADITVVYGVNHHLLTAEHDIISSASCTTNCLAPMAKIMHELVGIEKGYVTTIHAYTGDQQLLDANHKDLRRARAAALSMTPTTTGAAKAVGLVLPELAGKLDGCAMRVPTPNVSFVDLCFLGKKSISVNEINRHAKQQADNMAGVLAYCDEPLVSIDYNHHPASCIFDGTQTQIVGDDFIRVGGWYDNEWGFSLRMIDNLKVIAKFL